MMNLVRNNESLRILSQIFTPSAIRQVVKKFEFESQITKVRKHLEYTDSTDFINVIKFVYEKLEANYRNEYVYKNTLLIQKLLNEHKLNETVVLDEFRIGNSIADFVLLNGEVRIFEIKTDLDSFEKLTKQVEDYQKFADKVFVVIGYKSSKKILETYKISPVGVIAYTDEGKLETIKEANSFTNNFNHATIFKTLRQKEYLEIIKNHFGFIPEVPNTLIFKECLELITNIDVKQFQQLAFNKLKKRKLECSEFLSSEQTPKELKHICYTLNLSDDEYTNLYNYLNTKI